MLAEIMGKIRALVGDAPAKNSFEVFTYTVSGIFTIAEQNITLTTVLINNVETSDYSYNASNGKITVTASGLSSGDIVQVDFTYSNYSDTELKEYLRAALTYISIYSADDQDLEIEDESIYPTPSNSLEDLIAIITSIIIKPNFAKKTVAGNTTVYPKTMSKEKMIEEKIVRFNRGLGVTGIISL